MSNSKIRERLAAALPIREVRQPRAAELALPDAYGWDSVTAAPGGAGGGTSSTLQQVLQSTLKEVSDAVTQNNKQLTDLQTAQLQLLESTNQNTTALTANTTAKGGSGSSALSTIGSVASEIFGQGSILSPIVGGIMSLLGGGQSTPQPIFSPYIAPPSVNLQTTVNAPAPSVAQASPTVASGGAQGGSGTGAQIQIQVNAVDSKSFLDHSNEIAEAVRQALLNSHSLGDVIAEL